MTTSEMTASIGPSNETRIQPEYPPSGRAGSDMFLLALSKADGEELADGGTLVVQDSQCTIAGTGEGAGLLDNMVEQGREFEIRLEQKCRLEDPLEFEGILDRPEWHRSPAYRRDPSPSTSPDHPTSLRIPSPPRVRLSESCSIERELGGWSGEPGRVSPR